MLLIPFFAYQSHRYLSEISASPSINYMILNTQVLLWSLYTFFLVYKISRARLETPYLHSSLQQTTQLFYTDGSKSKNVRSCA